MESDEVTLERVRGNYGQRLHPRSISLSSEMIDEIDELARARNTNRSVLIREAWAYYMAAGVAS